jgi:hypothetical protein
MFDSPGSRRDDQGAYHPPYCGCEECNARRASTRSGTP